MDAIKIRGVRRIVDATALKHVQIKRPIAAKFHIKARVGKSIALTEEDAANVRDNILDAKAALNKFGSRHGEGFTPIEGGQVGKVLFGCENFLPVLNEITAAESKLNRIVGKGGYQLR